MKKSQSQATRIKNPHKNQVLKDQVALLSPLEKAIYDRLLYGFAQYKHNWISQQSIADFVQCSRRHVIRCIQTLVRLGLITKERPYRFSTCNYYLPAIMKTNPIVDLLKGFFPNLRYFWVSTALSLSLLIPGGKLNPRHVTARGTCHTIIPQDLLGFDVKTDENNKYRAPTSARESHSGKPETGGEWTPGERKTSASGIRNQKEREISNLYPSPVIKKAEE